MNVYNGDVKINPEKLEAIIERQDAIEALLDELLAEVKGMRRDGKEYVEVSNDIPEWWFKPLRELPKCGWYNPFKKTTIEKLEKGGIVTIGDVLEYGIDSHCKRVHDLHMSINARAWNYSCEYLKEVYGLDYRYNEKIRNGRVKELFHKRAWMPIGWKQAKEEHERRMELVRKVKHV